MFLPIVRLWVHVSLQKKMEVYYYKMSLSLSLEFYKDPSFCYGEIYKITDVFKLLIFNVLPSSVQVQYQFSPIRAET